MRRGRTIEVSAGDVQGAVDDMAPVPQAGGGGAARALGGGQSLTVNINGDLYFAGQKATGGEKASLADAIKLATLAGGHQRSWR